MGAETKIRNLHVVSREEMQHMQQIVTTVHSVITTTHAIFSSTLYVITGKLFFITTTYSIILHTAETTIRNLHVVSREEM